MENNESIYKVYVDESGRTPYYNDDYQPVFNLVGIITKSTEQEFGKEAMQILKSYNLDPNIEMHAYDIFRDNKSFKKLRSTEKEQFFLDFIELGIKYIDYIFEVGSLKCFILQPDRINFEKINLDPPLMVLYHFMIELDIYMHYKLNSYYEIYLDKSNDFKRTKIIINDLIKNNDQYYYLKRLKNQPNQIDSLNSRYIQYADFVCYILSRHRRITIKTFRDKIDLKKHEQFITECYDKIKIKIIHDNVDAFVKAIVENDISADELMTRDFSHLGNIRSKKNKPDKFDPLVSSYYEEIYKEKAVENMKIKYLIGIIDQLAKIKIQEISKDKKEDILRYAKELAEYLEDYIPDYGEEEIIKECKDTLQNLTEMILN